MKNLIARNLAHRGTIVSAGFLFSAQLLPEDETRRRVLSLWQTGAKVYRREDFVFLQLPQPFRIDSRRAAGLPLVRYGKILSSFPLAEADLAGFEDFGEAIVFLVAGRLQTIEIRDLTEEKIETWFDVADFKALETKTLGEIKTQPILLKKVAAVNLRDELTAVPQADAEMIEILRILKQKKAENLKNKTNPILSGQGMTAGNPPFPNFLTGAFDALKNLFARRGGQNQNANFQSPPPAKTSGKLRRLLTRTLFQMRVAQIFGRKQAKYLANMMEMFERGDLQEALKHAIPLEDMQALQELTENAPFLGFLRPRDSLQIQFGRQTAAGSPVFLDNDWIEQLRQTYRQTFERLVAQGKIEEAAFVLAELLKSNAEAVEFLEKYGKLRLAAELAESRDLPKETVVRQWFIAGEKRRAIQLAVRHNCFEYVVTKLETEKHQQSAELRELWAETLVAGGNLPAAVSVIWSLENKRECAAAWIDEVIEFGGVPAAQMLVKKIALFPNSFSAVKEKLFEFLPEASAEASEKRIALAREAITQTPNQELRLLMRPLVRKILADWTENSQKLSAHEFRQLVAVTNDFALRTDLPDLPETQKNAEPEEVFSLEISARDCGANHVFDACLLPDGKIAVALGEAGVKILSRENKLIAHFDQPTQKFVVSDLGTKAVGLMRRGKSYRLTKFDFVTRRANYWCEAAISSFAPTFDGNLWFAGRHDALSAIDTNAKDFEAVWQVSDIGGVITEVSRSKTKLLVLVDSANGSEKWSYELPNLVLRSRNQVKGWYQTENENQFLLDISASVAYSVALKRQTSEKNELSFDIEVYDYETQIAKMRLSSETVDINKPQIAGKHFAVISRTKTAATINLYSFPHEEIALFRLCESKSCSVRLDERFLTITDEAGRIIVFDYGEKLLRKNLRY